MTAVVDISIHRWMLGRLVRRRVRGWETVRGTVEAWPVEVPVAEGTPIVVPTDTVTFLLTDIEGSTALWEREPATTGEVVARHYTVIDAVVSAHGGVRPVEQGEGDSVVVAFKRASDAVAVALDIQQTLAATVPAVEVRIAVHTGEPQLRDGDNYMGHTVIRCARLRACAHGGQVLLSDVTAGLVADHLPTDATVRDLGVHRLRDLARPERVWQLGPSAHLSRRLRAVADRWTCIRHNLSSRPFTNRPCGTSGVRSAEVRRTRTGAEAAWSR